jgi:signal transduction histidine kinase
MPPRAEGAPHTPAERRGLQDTLAWPIVVALLAGAVVVCFLPRFVPSPYMPVAVGVVFAVVTIALVSVLAHLIERWLRRHAESMAAAAERQVQAVGIAGLPMATGDGALIPLASAFADAGARVALQTAERETSEMLARLGGDVASTIAQVAARVRTDPGAALLELDDVADALRRVSAPVPVALASVDLVSVLRAAVEGMPPEEVDLVVDTDRAMVTVDPQRMAVHLRDLVMLARAASPQCVPVTVHISRRFRSNIEETPVRRTGDSPLTIVPRSSGDALRAWVLRAQPGAEVLSVIITDGGGAPPTDAPHRAFDAFALARPGDSLGVVLATARRTVTAARGTLWIDGAREGGSAVHLLLPIAAS